MTTVDLEALDKDGYTIVEGGLRRDELSALIGLVSALPQPGPGKGGIRGLLGKSSGLEAFAQSGLPGRLAVEALGPGAAPVKATLFEKSEQANWKVPLHQDLMIAVERRIETEGFGAWSLKESVVHVKPPEEVLSRMLAIRVHLDDTTSDNGALVVVPGSHRHGRLSKSEMRALRARSGVVSCPVGAGGAMLMSPLLLHASATSIRPDPRRVLHIEYSAAGLPGGLSWAR